ncbi:alpha/beta fold hydrolase [Streptomyces sp. CA-100214]
MSTVNANGVTLGVESFGDDDAPLVLLAGGTTMLSWPDALCERLAAGGRRVVRYDLRDSGESTTADPQAPAYTLRDLASDAAALVRALGGGPAHLAGTGVGGMVAQVAALDHPEAFSALTLAGTRAVAPGPPDDDLPDHDAATMSRLFAHPMPDWTDREAVAEFAAAGAAILGDDPDAARATAARVWDRTPAPNPPCTWPTSSAWSSPRSTARPAGGSGCPGSRSPRSSSTAAATRSSPSATPRRSRARSPEPGCSCWRTRRPRSPTRRPGR